MRKYTRNADSRSAQRVAAADKNKDSHTVGWPHFTSKGACICECRHCLGAGGCICKECSGVGHVNCRRAKVNSDGSPKAVAAA